MRCRKNVNDLSLDEKKRFIRACEVLKTKPSTLNPGAQHRYDDFVQVHREAMSASNFPPDPGWAHFDSAFFPWHREFLYRFEEELRLIDLGVTIPYWDWTRGQAASNPAFPFTHDFIGVDGTDAQADRVLKEPGAPSPYPYEFDPEAWDIVVKDGPEIDDFTRAFAERSDAPNLPDNDNVVVGAGTSFRNAIAATSYVSLRGRSEDLHNLVHRWVGGNMVTMSSPNDPVFWTHHAAIDRMWTMWQDLHPAVTPYVHTGGWPGHGIGDTLTFHGLGDTAPWSGTATPQQVTNSHAMHGESIWYWSDRPEVSLTANSVSLGPVPQGMTQYLAAHFEVRSCRPVQFRITANPTGNFGLTPEGSQFSTPGSDQGTVDAYAWFQFVADGSGTQASAAVVEAYIVDTEGYYAAVPGGEHILGSWTIDLSASVVPREDNAVVLVLDRSWSMSAAAGGSSTRSALLKSAVGAFHALLRPTDEIGVVSFDDVTENLLPITTQSAGLGTTLTGAGLDPRGNTAIGLGIQSGFGMLTGASHTNRSLLVLTDGNQNVHPYIDELPPGTITNRTYAIGFGRPGEVSDAALHAITANTGGDLIVSGELPSAQEWFLLTKYFVQMLAGVTSANVVLDPDGELRLGSEHAIPFTVSRADVSIDVILLAPLAPFVEVVLRAPDGTEIDPAVAAVEPNVEFQLHEQLAFYRLDLPAIPGRPDGTHAGTWHIVARLRREMDLKPLTHRLTDLAWSTADVGAIAERGALPYSAVVHTRSNLDMQAKITQTSTDPGAIVGLTVSLAEYGVPFAGSAEVWAELSRPESTAPEKVPFHDDGDGRWRASFVAGSAGLHRVRIRAVGVGRYGSSFAREKSLTAGVFVPRPVSDQPTDPFDGKLGDKLCEMLRCLVEYGTDRDGLARCVETLCRDDKPKDVRPPLHRAPPPLTALPSTGALIVERDDPVIVQPTVEQRSAAAAERAERLGKMAKHPGHMLTMSVWGDQIPKGESAAKQPPKTPPKKRAKKPASKSGKRSTEES
ncbi:MAG: tyrosinase family protein [Ilumatobacteraceae bacterium]